MKTESAIDRLEQHLRFKEAPTIGGYPYMGGAYTRDGDIQTLITSYGAILNELTALRRHQ